ncbi:MAG: hypothetical protein KKB13_27465 [Chloroflexi bacterium]|nr:hypothetical protein [Chloroflexota bacterium]
MSATSHTERRAALLIGLSLVAVLVVLGLGTQAARPAAAAPPAAPQFDPCGGCPASYECRLVWQNGVSTWTCVWVGQSTPVPTNPPGPTPPPGPTQPPGPTAPPGPTPPPGTPGPTTPAATPTPCDYWTEIISCVWGACSPGQGIDVRVYYDCQTGLIIAHEELPCHDCFGTPTPTVSRPTVVPPTPICMPVYSGGSVSFDPACIAQVQAAIPCVRVTREPYPRGLVSVPMQFTLGGPDQAEMWSNPLPEGVPPGTVSCMGQSHARYRDYQLGLKWVRIGSAAWGATGLPGPQPGAPYWTFDERSWNPGGSASGETVMHRYETSSWGKPTNGPAGLPAYQVSLSTYWGLFWAVQYDEWQCVAGEDRCVPRNPDGTCRGQATAYQPWCGDLCPNQSGNARWVCTACDWVHQFDGWHLIDLRPYGSPNWYDTSQKVALPQQGVGCANVIPVPVIEAQGVIEQ